MPINDEEYFKKEFDRLVRERKQRYGGAREFDFTTIPVVPFGFALEGTDTGWAQIKGVPDGNIFKALEGKFVELLKGTTFQHRVSYNGAWVYDRDGSLRVEDVHLPKNCVAIRTKVKLVIRKIDEHGRKINLPDDYGVIDFEEDDSGKPIAYMYYVPKSVVYEAYPLALCVAKNKHDNRFWGQTIKLQNGDDIYLYVIPYSKDSETEGTNKRIIGIKVGCTDASMAFRYEIEVLKRFWLGETIVAPNVPIRQFVKCYTRYFDAAKTSKNDRIRARGSLRLPRCRIVLMCEADGGRRLVGSVDMTEGGMHFRFDTADTMLKDFHWQFNKPIPNKIDNLKICRMALERIGVTDNVQQTKWFLNYAEEYNKFRLFNGCALFKGPSCNYTKVMCGSCGLCMTKEQRVYISLLTDYQFMTEGKMPKEDLGLNLRWFDSVMFDKNILCSSDGSNFVEHDDDNVKASYEYVPMSATALDNTTTFVQTEEEQGIAEGV